MLSHVAGLRTFGLVVGSLALVPVLVPAAVAAPISKYQQQKQEQLKAAAPADMYFGRMKLSFLGINNTFKDAAFHSNPYTTDSGITNKVDFGIESLNDWANKYPRDSHLSRSYFLGGEAFKKIWVKQYQDKAWSYMQLIVTKYPTTFFGKIVKADLAKGFTKHYFAAAVACGAEPSATAPPVTTTDPKGFQVEVLTPPCVPAASPSPASVGSPEPGAVPGASSSPSTAPGASVVPEAAPHASLIPSVSATASAAPSAKP